jgi:PAS domain S-box-containing protein
MKSERKSPRTLADLAQENRTLRLRLDEAQQTLQALRAGEVDALVVSGPAGEQVFSLAGSEHVYRVVVERMQEAALTVDMDGTIVFCNGRFCEMVRTSMEEVIAHPLEAFVDPRQADGVAELMRQGSTGTVRGRILLKPRGGDPLPVRITGSLIDLGQGPGLCLIASDLTEIETSAGRIQSLREHQQALEQSEEVLRTTLETARRRTEELETVMDLAPAVILVARDPECRFIAGNRFAHKMHQVPAGENLSPEPAPGQLNATRRFFKNGRELPPAELPMQQAATGREIIGAELDLLLPDGDLRTLLGNASPLFDSQGRSRGSIGIFIDATERRKAEALLHKANQDLEERVRERTAELAETVDELRAAYAQLDARAKQLRALAGELTMAEQRERKRLAKVLHDGLQQHLAAAKLQLGALSVPGAQRTAAAIEQLLSEAIQMSRSLSAELCPPVLHVNGLSAGLEWLRNWMRDRHEFQVDLALDGNPDLPEDVRVLVFESVRELMFNAAKHANVSRARVELRGPDARGELTISVSDAGIGFESGHPPTAGAGGGYGLFSIRERVELIGGRFEFASTPGEGSRFAITLPRCAMATDCSGSDAAEDTPSTGEEPIRVLLADDHTLVRDGIARLVKREPGLDIVGEARDGEEAIELARALSPDVILMDISMPRLNGIDATRIIHKELPAIRIIGLSMYDDPVPVQALRTAGAADFKNKGCAASELIAAIRRAMGHPPRAQSADSAQPVSISGPG